MIYEVSFRGRLKAEMFVDSATAETKPLAVMGVVRFVDGAGRRSLGRRSLEPEDTLLDMRESKTLEADRSTILSLSWLLLLEPQGSQFPWVHLVDLSCPVEVAARSLLFHPRGDVLVGLIV
jgi:hypothetical protein